MKACDPTFSFSKKFTFLALFATFTVNCEKIEKSQKSSKILKIAKNQTFFQSEWCDIISWNMVRNGLLRCSKVILRHFLISKHVWDDSLGNRFFGYFLTQKDLKDYFLGQNINFERFFQKILSNLKKAPFQLFPNQKGCIKYGNPVIYGIFCEKKSKNRF